MIAWMIELNFPIEIRKDWASSSRYLEKASIAGIKKGTSVVLGFSILGVAQWLDFEEVQRLENNVNDPLSPELGLYHKRLVEHKREDVEVIVFRLFFE